MSAEFVEAYHQALGDLNSVPLLEQALEAAFKKCRFFPSVAEIRDEYDLAREKSYRQGRVGYHTELPDEQDVWVYPADPAREPHYLAEATAEGSKLLVMLRRKALDVGYPPYRVCTAYKSKLHRFDHCGKGGQCACGFKIAF